MAAPLTYGRPLFAGHSEVPQPDEPHLALWHAITVLREFRGDGHVAALVGAGLSGVEALLLHGASRVRELVRPWSKAIAADALPARSSDRLRS